MRILFVCLAVVLLVGCWRSSEVFDSDELVGTWRLTKATNATLPSREFRIQIKATRFENTYRAFLEECTPDFLFFSVVGSEMKPFEIKDLKDENGDNFVGVCTGGLREHAEIRNVVAGALKSAARIHRDGRNVRIRNVSGGGFEIQKSEI